MKRVISLIVSVLVMLACSMPVFATNDHISADDTVTYVNRYNELLSYGLTAAEANQLLRVETITAKLERANVTLTEKDGTYQLVSNDTSEVLEVQSGRSVAGVTTAELNYLTELLQDCDSKEVISYEEMLSDIADAAEADPGRTQYRITYDSNRWIEVNILVERSTPLEENVVKTYFDNPTFPNEVEIRSDTEIVLDDGDYNYTCEIKVFEGVYYAQCYISQNATYSNDGTHVEINSIQSGQAAAGVIGIANASKNINVASTDLNEKPKIWCEVQNEVVFSVTGSVGVSLGGVFSISVTAGNSWTQYAIIRSSIAAMHSYGAYYTVLD